MRLYQSQIVSSVWKTSHSQSQISKLLYIVSDRCIVILYGMSLFYVLMVLVQSSIELLYPINYFSFLSQFSRDRGTPDTAMHRLHICCAMRANGSFAIRGNAECRKAIRGNLRNVPHLIFRKLPLDNFPHSAIRKIPAPQSNVLISTFWWPTVRPAVSCHVVRFSDLPLNFRPMSVVAKRLERSRCTWYGGRPTLRN